MALPYLQRRLRTWKIHRYQLQTNFARDNNYASTSTMDGLFSSISNRNVMETYMIQLFNTLFIISCFPSGKLTQSPVGITREDPVAEMDVPRTPLDDPRFVPFAKFPYNIRIMINDALIGYGSDCIAKAHEVLNVIFCNIQRINKRKQHEHRVICTHWFRNSDFIGLYDQNVVGIVRCYLPHLQVNRLELWCLIQRYRMIAKFGFCE
eukprot:180106_1